MSLQAIDFRARRRGELETSSGYGLTLWVAKDELVVSLVAVVDFYLADKIGG